MKHVLYTGGSDGPTRDQVKAGFLYFLLELQSRKLVAEPHPCVPSWGESCAMPVPVGALVKALPMTPVHRVFSTNMALGPGRIQGGLVTYPTDRAAVKFWQGLNTVIQ